MHCPYCGKWCVRSHEGFHACSVCGWTDKPKPEALPIPEPIPLIEELPLTYAVPPKREKKK